MISDFYKNFLVGTMAACTATSAVITFPQAR